MSSAAGSNPFRLRRRPADRASRIEQVVDQIMARQASGKMVDEVQITSAHADLMPELGDRLRLLRGLWVAAERAARTSAGDEPGCDSLTRFDDRPRASVGEYDLLERIHEGGQGVVYKALQASSGKVVALKLLLDGPLATERQRRRFAREVKVLASKLRHPHIVALFESGHWRGRPYFTMEYVDGLPIDDHAMIHALSVQDRVKLVRDVCDAVAHAHQNLVIHRDLKPSNILVDGEGAVHVLDFGLAKEVSGDGDGPARTRISITGQVVGTLPYLSPEQAAGEEVDVRSDIYALGVLLYELLTGVYPYSVEGPTEQARARIRHDDPMRFAKALALDRSPEGVSAAELGSDLEHVVRKALEKDRARRYQSASALAEDLGRYLSGDPVAAGSGRGLYLLGRMLKKHWRPTAVAACFLLMVGAFGGKILRLSEEKAAVAATRDLRSDLAAEGFTSLFNRWEGNEKLGIRVIETEDMPPQHIPGHLKRYRRVVEDGPDLALLAEGMPMDMPGAIRSNDRDMRAAAASWLSRSELALDALSELLEHASLRLSAAPMHMGKGVRESVLFPASCMSQAFVARAYCRQERSDHVGALSDLTAASWLALDVSDGANLFARHWSLQCRRSVYRFLLQALTDALRENRPVKLYLDWIERDPMLPRLGPAWEIEWKKAMAASHGWFVTDAAGTTERLDLMLMDRSYVGGSSPLAAMTVEDRAAAQRLNRDEVAAAIQRYLDWTPAWDDLDYATTLKQITEFERLIKEESRSNPVLSYLPNGFQDSYSLRLRVSTLRRVIRLLAGVIKYRDTLGEWPSQMEGIATSPASKDLIDPISSEPFIYDVFDGLPRIRSIWFDDLYVRSDCRGPWIDDGEELATYFPAPAEKLEKLQSADDPATAADR